MCEDKTKMMQLQMEEVHEKMVYMSGTCDAARIFLGACVANSGAKGWPVILFAYF